MVELRVYYDFASPFCYVALEIARRLRRTRDLGVTWLPFEVIDYLPERGAMPRNPAFVRRGEAERTAKLAAAYDLDIHVRDRLLNSNLALSAVEHAKLVAVRDGDPGLVDRVLTAMFEAFYRDQRDISDLAVVLDVASVCQLKGEIAEVLTTGRYREQVALSRAGAHEMGVVAVPTWLASGYGAVGIPAYAELERLLDTAEGAAGASRGAGSS